MRYTVRKSVARLIGTIWMPSATCAQCLTLSAYDIENARDSEGKITRDSVERWLMTHSGDFQRVIDWEASIEDGDDTIDIPWSSEESEFTYSDCMYGSED